MVCGDRSGDAAYGKIMKFITQNVMLFNYSIFHILPISVNIFQKWFAVVWGGLRWFAVIRRSLILWGHTVVSMGRIRGRQPSTRFPDLLLYGISVKWVVEMVNDQEPSSSAK